MEPLFDTKDRASALLPADAPAGPATPATGPATPTARAEQRQGKASLSPGPRVLGLDLSLTSTGLAYADDRGTIAIRAITTTKQGDTITDQHHRLSRILEEIWRPIHMGHQPDLVVLEGPSYGSKGAGTWDRGGLWWLVVSHFLTQRIPLAVVPPALLKKYATGKGGGKDASKTAVASTAANRYGRVFASDDEADAYVLCAMGLDHLGHPPAPVPQTHRQALAKVAWPTARIETP
ncbi:hypothetical protein SAMN04489712_105256 [Thermomonospora echinospora]|uniref:Uncharacterized protein n=2 Tax=Thermomonospora echinospora TaxID=1992 RepID=A0A1H6A720_9ACTN|nr:hypothetical protein SAMN04489712_105256 [Thermomonospora echinospora]